MEKSLNIFDFLSNTLLRLVFSVAILFSVAFFVRVRAQVTIPGEGEDDALCEFYRTKLNYTDYYCECLNHGLPFHYGVDTIIQGVNWYTATLNDVSAGFSAYWFSTTAVTIDGFVSCAQDSATITQTVGANRSYHADIQSLLGRFGAGGMSSTLSGIDLHVRTTQPDGSEGRLIITPFDKGPHSTCENPLPVYFNMPYVVSDSDNVYMMPPSTHNISGEAVRWVCERGDEIRIEVGRGSCDAAPFMTTTLRDSLHVWTLPYDVLRQAQLSKDTLYFHCYTNARLGEVWFLRPLEFLSDTLDTTVCMGTKLDYYGIQSMRDTLYADTVYLGYDTVSYKRQLQVTTYNLHFSAPEVEYDTIRCHSDSLGFFYLGAQSQQVRQFGDFSFYYRRAGECDRDIRLHVDELLYPQNITVDTTLCEGRRLRIGGKNYMRDTVFAVSTWQGKQEVITTYIVHFTSPELTNDTIRCHADSLPFNYRGLTDQRITAFGTKVLTLTDRTYQNCTEKVSLTVEQLWYNDTTYRDTTLCAGGTFGLTNAEALADNRYVYRWADKATKHVVYYNITFVEPELEYDSLLLHITRMPYNYYGHILTSYGDTLLRVTQQVECDRLVRLHTEEYVFPITRDTFYVDTTFCRGMSFTLHDSVYTSTTQFVDTFWAAEYEVQYTYCNIVVTEPELELDSVSVLASALPFNYEGKEIGVFGTHLLYFNYPGECDRIVSLLLQEKPVVRDTLRSDTVLCSGQILYLEDTVIFTSTFFARDFWSAGLDSCLRREYNITYEDGIHHFDTISAFFSQLPYHYEAYPGGKNLQTFGDYMFTYEPINECKQVFNVMLQQLQVRDTIVSNDTVCAGAGMEMHYSETKTNDNRSMRQADSIYVYIYNVYVAQPVVFTDTIAVWSDSLPALYHGQAFMQTGDYQLSETDAEGCLVLTNLHVEVMQKQDDALPTVRQPEHAEKFIHNGQLYILYRDALYDARGNRLTHSEIK